MTKKNKTTLAIASDHAGYELKSQLKQSFVLEDLGSDSTESVDYPDFALRMAEYIKNNPESYGLLVCGSGIGISIAANRFSHIRAALCKTSEDAVLARSHNNANVLVLSGRQTSTEDAKQIITSFLDTEFEGGRHNKRIDKISEASMFQKRNIQPSPISISFQAEQLNQT